MYLMFMNYLKEEMHQVPEDTADANNQGKEKQGPTRKQGKRRDDDVCVWCDIVDRVRYPALRTFQLEVLYDI